MVGDRIRQLREDREISQKTLAEFINVSPSTVGMYEQGRRVPSTEILNLIATFFDVTSDFLLERTNNPHTKVSEIDYEIVERSKKVLDVIKNAGVKLENIDYDKLEQLLKLANVEKEK